MWQRIYSLNIFCFETQYLGNIFADYLPPEVRIYEKSPT